MARVAALAKLKTNAQRFVRPTIRNFNRLEAIPRDRDFERAISLESHDALWALNRQWSFGEFQGEDAARAKQARVLATHRIPGQLVLGQNRAQPLSSDIPLEAQIEQEHIEPTLFDRARAGRRFIQLLTQNRVKRYAALFLKEFPETATVDDGDEDGNRLSKALGSNTLDGNAVLKAILDGTYDSFVQTHPDIAGADRAKLRDCADSLLSWSRRLFQQPIQGQSAWDPSHLEYQATLVSREQAGTVLELVADQYAGGHLDWKDFDQRKVRRPNPTSLPETRKVADTFIPTQLKFAGMPHPRLWQLEDATVNFGKLSSSPTAILDVLLAQYGLNYSNDWFVLPYELPINTVCEIQSILVTDVFGQHFLVRPTVDDPEQDWQQFAMFHQTERDIGSKGRSVFYLAPAVGQMQESEDIERVNFIRDEMSNLVWSIEQVIQSEGGDGRHLKRDVPSLADFEPVSEEAEIRYVLGNTVPDNWIPFIPVRKRGTMQEIRLQRARMPQAQGPKSRVLTESQPVYFVEDEEVSRSGTIVSRRYQRTRWLNGRTVLWVGRRKQTGRGEGAANLQFDSVLPITD